MDQSLIYEKTAAGAEEVKARSRRLQPRLRTMLIMVDGTMNAAQLQAAATTLGAPENFLAVLVEQGLVQAREKRVRAAEAADLAASPAAVPDIELPADETVPGETERFRMAQKLMNDSVVDALGLRAFFFTLKLERCYTCADLAALLPEYGKAVTKGSGESAGRLLVARVKQILG